jgi:predicted lipid-binding transport protein (Tim44 family)
VPGIAAGGIVKAMATVLLTLLLLATVVLLAKSYYDAQQRQQTIPTPKPPRAGRYRPRPRRQQQPIDEEKLAEHVKALREAVGEGLISRQEAAASIVRQTEGQLSEEAALQLLRSRTA